MNRQGIEFSRGFRAFGFTLIEVLVIFVMIGFIIVGANLGPDLVGGGRWLGGILGFVSFLAAGAALCLIMDYGVRGVPYLPTCRNGRCRGGDDYQIRRFLQDYVWACRCGVHYQRRGRRFVVVNEDGTEMPYLIWRPFRGWSIQSPPE